MSDHEAVSPAGVEEWRKALEAVMTTYVDDQFNRLGSCSTYAQTDAAGNITLICCIESHQYKQQNFWFLGGWVDFGGFFVVFSLLGRF